MIPISIHTESPETQVSISSLQATTKAELGRLVHAALVNTRFRQLLLTNPVTMIERGYLGESFHFPSEVKEQIQEVHANSLQEFSSCVLQIVDAPSVAEIAVLHYR